MQLRTLISLAVATVCVCIAISCRRPAAVDDPGTELSGEPEQFSATIVHAVDDGVERELSVTRIFKSGNLRREEWIEQGESRALIWRLDLGKTYLLDIEGRCYVESGIAPDITSDNALNESTVSQNRSPEGELMYQSSASGSRDEIAGELVDRALDHPPSPVHVENRRLSDRTIDGHPCAVFERREVFAGNHSSVTTIFRARDLNGLAIRIETTGPGEASEGAKLITKWLDFRGDVPPDVFTVPADFRRVDKLPR